MKFAVQGAVLGTMTVLAGCAEDPSIDVSNPPPTPTERKCATRNVPADEAVAVELTVPGDPVTSDLEEVTFSIPVFTHVILGSGGTGDVPDSQIAAQIQVLNDAYGGHTGGANMRMSFFNAGIDRTTNAQWFTVTPDSSAERDMKSSLRKGGADTLNVYLANIGDGLLGWATFPSDYASDPDLDGVVILNTSVPGGGSAPFDEGDTLTHEAGHWVGLFHTFESGCSSPGDLVKDTPRVAQPNFGCPAAVDSCPSAAGDIKRPDLITNFMDYVDDSCMNEFTPGQKTRATRYFSRFRDGK